MADYNERSTETADLNPLWETILDLNVDIAELNYANSLNADNRDQLFVDPFVDMSKIDSSSNMVITIGQNGDLELDYSWTGSEQAYNSFSLNRRTSTVDHNIDVKAQGIFTEIGFSSDVSTSYDLTIYRNGSAVVDLNSVSPDLVDGNFKKIYLTKEDYSQELESGDNVRVEVYDQGNGSIGELDDTPTYTGTSFDLPSNSSGLSPYNDNGQLFTFAANKTYSSSGKITSVTIDKGYIPTAVQLDADKATDSETSVSARVFDGNGNEKTISESQFGDEISVPFTDSSFQTELQLSTSNTSKTPTANDYGLRVIQ